MMSEHQAGGSTGPAGRTRNLRRRNTRSAALSSEQGPSDRSTRSERPRNRGRAQNNGPPRNRRAYVDDSTFYDGEMTLVDPVSEGDDSLSDDNDDDGAMSTSSSSSTSDRDDGAGDVSDDSEIVILPSGNVNNRVDSDEEVGLEEESENQERNQTTAQQPQMVGVAPAASAPASEGGASTSTVGPINSSADASSTTTTTPSSSSSSSSVGLPSKASTSSTAPSTKRPRVSDECNTNLDDGGMTCTICFEPYTSSGAHRLVCLWCGHLFGKQCIEKWLKSSGKAAKCPTCKKTAKLKDVRDIYGSLVKMIDTSELERAKIAVAALRAENDKQKLELAEYRLRVEKLQRERMNSSLSYSAQLARMVVTCGNQAAQALNMKPFGWKEIDMRTERVLRYIPAHEGRPRDCQFAPENCCHGAKSVLSTGDDKTLCVSVSGEDSSPVKRFILPSSGWSCGWGAAESPYVYAGVHGKVCAYDLRTAGGSSLDESQPVVELLGTTAGRIPITSLDWVSASDGGSSSRALHGLLITSLKQCLFYSCERSSATTPSGTPHVLINDEGQITSLAYDKQSRKMMATFRPNPELPFLTDKLYELHVQNSAETEGGFDVRSTPCGVHSLNSRAQVYLTKQALFRHGGCLMSASVDEGDAKIRLFDWEKRMDKWTIPLPTSDRQVCQVVAASLSDLNTTLAVLTPKKVHLYRMS